MIEGRRKFYILPLRHAQDSLVHIILSDAYISQSDRRAAVVQELLNQLYAYVVLIQHITERLAQGMRADLVIQPAYTRGIVQDTPDVLLRDTILPVTMTCLP